ncbi:uncharacterized protein LOC128730606 [Anopheles nili]|uniref:uncharacterized protein LOC128730606 n=1 Tax=Anopheles nili TaxID=185578 RepID=UPI00237B4F0C|nr:uncharacterized protein LOC128730606 [Anopheles nili]
MWKYVSRRIRDVYDKTANVLEVRRTWNCGAKERFCADNSPDNGSGCSGTEQQQDADGRRFCLLHAARPNQLGDHERKEYGTGSNHSEREGFRRKEYQQAPFDHSWIGAITWTSAIICGWYTSQLLCLYRRTQQFQQSSGQCIPSPLLRAASEQGKLSARHCEALALYFGLKANAGLTSPFPKSSIRDVAASFDSREQKSCALLPSYARFVPFNGHDYVDYTDTQRSELKHFVFEDNDNPKSNANTPPAEFAPRTDVPLPAVHQLSKEQTQQSVESVESAFKNLVSVLGEIEYQLGCRNLELGEYASAVSHLKLGASHHHAGAAFNLGICYEQGYGIPKDMRMAMECYQLAAKRSHPQAIYNLAVFHARGYAGLRPNRSMAKKYFVAAAELGLEDAIAALGPKYKRSRKNSAKDDSITSARNAVKGLPAFKLSLQNFDQFPKDSFKAERLNEIQNLVAASG